MSHVTSDSVCKIPWLRIEERGEIYLIRLDRIECIYSEDDITHVDLMSGECFEFEMPIETILEILVK